MMHKYHALIAYIKDLESVAVAFSGGVDSTFLLAAAVETLGDRALAKKIDLPTWNKPASACLSSRIPYGQKITIRKLNRIEQAEDVLRDMGFVQLRVRDYDETCRIEVPCADLPRFMAEGTRKDVIAKLKIAGYKFICLDLEGYRPGSMNEVLSTNEKEKARKEKLPKCLNRSQQPKPLNC